MADDTFALPVEAVPGPRALHLNICTHLFVGQVIFQLPSTDASGEWGLISLATDDQPEHHLVFDEAGNVADFSLAALKRRLAATTPRADIAALPDFYIGDADRYVAQPWVHSFEPDPEAASKKMDLEMWTTESGQRLQVLVCEVARCIGRRL